ncbi:MAG: glutathione-regulated potassium-efflux system protein KefC [Polyangiaceae bacterium]
MNHDSPLLSAIVFLTAAVVCVPIASRLKLGSVLGYLAAGCIIGPFGLRLIPDPQATLHFAEIGVVLMLFVIGLELDPSHLLHLRKPVFGGGSLQLVASALVLGAGALLLGLPWQAALVAGLALALSSTAVCMQTLNEKNLAAAPVGRAAFAVLLFQDIAAIPLLAIVPLLGLRDHVEDSSRWLAVTKAVLAIVLVILIGRFLTRPILRVLARTGLREVFSGFSLLLVLGIAMLMESVGVSMALGAFLAGLLLASSEYRHALETDIEPFKGLLMGLFFIAVGMSIDFGLLARSPLSVVLLLCGFQAAKILTLRLVAGPIGVRAEQRWLFSALLAQGGEFAFVVFGVASHAHVLPGEWDKLLTLSVALSMALTPVLLIASDRLARRFAAPKAAEADVIESRDPPVIIAGFGRFGQIVARLLFASGIKATVLDHDPDQVEALRRFGFRVYYGDATRLNLLHAAGAEQARLLVLAVDDPETSIRVVDAVKEHFPELAIVARARNVSHWQQLRSRGVRVVERETFEAAVLVGRRVLEALGVGPYEARERADAFRRHNVRTLEEILPLWEDEAKRTNIVRSAREQLERQMERERTDRTHEGNHGWQTEGSPSSDSPPLQKPSSAQG